MLEHKFLESMHLYAAGALSAAEKDSVERHLREGCEICEPELWVIHETCSRLPYALPDHPLPPSLKEKIQERIDSEFKPQRSRSRSIAFLPLAASLILAVLAAALLWNQRSLLTAKEKEIEEMRKLLLQRQQEIAWLRDPSVQLAMLSGLTPLPEATGKMVWSPAASRGIFYGSSLPPPLSGKTYQLWVIGNKGPVSAGVFRPEPNGTAVVTISVDKEAPRNVLQFAVTIEPSGGVPQPTGSMILAGNAL